MEGVDRGVPHSQFPPPFPPLPSPVSPLPSPFSPTSLPLLDFSLPLIKCCSYLRIKVYVYVSEELRLVHHRLSCRIFMHNYQVGKEPDYLQISVFSRTSKGNIIYTRQNKKTSCLCSLLAPISILSLVYILDFLKDFCFTFFIQKVLYKKSLPTYRPFNKFKILKR